MKVKELIEKLKEFDGDLDIVVSNRFFDYYEEDDPCLELRTNENDYECKHGHEKKCLFL